MLMAMYTKVIGEMIRLMAMVYFQQSMVLLMKAIGKMTCNTEKEKRLGKMVLTIKEVISMGRRKGMANFNGMMDHSLRVISL